MKTLKANSEIIGMVGTVLLLVAVVTYNVIVHGIRNF